MKQQHRKLIKCQLGLSWVLLRNVITIVGVPTNLEFFVALLTFRIRSWKSRPSNIHRKIANSNMWRNQQQPNIYYITSLTWIWMTWLFPRTKRTQGFGVQRVRMNCSNLLNCCILALPQHIYNSHYDNEAPVIPVML